jgi:hypothetical protein
MKATFARSRTRPTITGNAMNTKPNRRQLTTMLGAAAVAVGLSACALLNPGPRTVDMSEQQLAALISRQFPFNSRYLEVFDIVLDAPRVRLMPAENRIGTELGYTLGAGLFTSRQFQGALNLSYGLRFDATDQTVRLADVRVENFEVPGVPSAYASRANRLGGLLAEGLLKDFVLYRLKPEDLQASSQWGYQPGPMTVVPGGLQLRLDPVPR